MGDTPLHLALVGGVAKVLLENGADPEVQNWRGETALNVAEAGGKEGVAKVLKSWIESGHKAPVEQVGHAGQQGPPPIPPRPGHELVRKSSLSGAKIAVEGGKKVNFADGVGRSGN